MKASNGSSATNAGNSQRRVSFALSGRSLGLDHRLHAYRDDVADIALAGKVLAHYYAVPVMRSCIADVADIHEEPSEDSTVSSQLLRNEAFAVVDQSGGWAWGFCEHDHYVGYIREDALGPFSEPVVSNAKYDPVVTAEGFIGAPYLWGGRTSAGIDCSGLVQAAWAAAGHSLPRDSDLQLDAISGDITDNASLERGDIVFFPNHVGVMTDDETLLHATQHYGKTVTEPLADVIARIAEEHDEPVLGRKRISL